MNGGFNLREGVRRCSICPLVLRTGDVLSGPIFHVRAFHRERYCERRRRLSCKMMHLEVI